MRYLGNNAHNKALNDRGRRERERQREESLTKRVSQREREWRESQGEGGEERVS